MRCDRKQRMEEQEGIKKLSELWEVAKSKQGVTVSRVKFIEMHSLQIRRLNKGYWVMPDALKYIEELEAAIKS